MAVVSTRGFRQAQTKAIEPPIAAARARSSADEEKRCLMAGVQLRAAKAGKGPGTVVGYAAVFSKMSQDLGYFVEKIQRGAFAGVLGQDVRALKNHDSNYLLGRSKSGTLRMSEDEIGLRVEIDLPDTQVGRDTAEEIGRGDMDGMSFSFAADVDQWDYSGEVPIRTLVKIRDLYDVGPVAYPAYTDTSAAMRSLETHRPKSDPPPATTPDDPRFDALESFHFRLKVEQAAVLPAPSE